MKCVHCGCTLVEPVTDCPSCKRNPLMPSGFSLDEKSGKYRMLAKGVDRRTKMPINVVTWYDPESGEYSQDIFDVDDAGVGVKELAPVEQATPAAEAAAVFEPQVETTPVELAMPAAEAAAVLDAQTETAPVELTAPAAEAAVVLETQTETAPVEPIAPAAEAAAVIATQDETASVESATPAAEAAVALDTQTETAPVELATPSAEAAVALDTQDETAPVEPTAPAAEVAVALDTQTETAPAEPDEAFVPREPALESYRVEKKGHGGIVFAVIVIILAGLLAAGWYFGYFDLLSERLGEQIEAVTEPPEGAEVPAFLPLEPVTPVYELVDVPEDKSRDESTARPVASAVNYYPQLPDVSAFSARALQDENHIYFLPVADDGVLKITDLMRIKTGTGKPEYIENFWPGSECVYSFTLLGENIIVCAQRPELSGFGFYSAPKSGGEPMLMFAYPSPAFINVYEDKLYMLFAQEKKLGVFDPRNDTSPQLFDLTTDGADGIDIFPYFSVMDGYVYYGGVHADANGARAVYYRAAADGSAPVSLLQLAQTNGVIMNPVFDGDNTYCGILGAEGYSFCVVRGGEVQVYYTFTPSPGILPIVAGAGTDSLIALVGDNDLTRYRTGDMHPEQDTVIEGMPYAATRDYLIATDGLYLNSDLSFTPFDAPAAE